MEVEQQLGTRRYIGALLRVPHRFFVKQLHAGLVAAGYTDIRPPYLAVFQQIDAQGSRLTDLAERAQITKQSMGYLVDYLETCGYVERASDPLDGRAKIVHLTGRGWALNERAREIAAQIEGEWANYLNANDWAELMRLLGTLSTHLEESGT